ncbi:unnamed protein product [Ixodes pacificus]
MIWECFSKSGCASACRVVIMGLRCATDGHSFLLSRGLFLVVYSYRGMWLWIWY